MVDPLLLTTEDVTPYLDSVKREIVLSTLPFPRAARIRSPMRELDRARRCAAEVALRRLCREAGEDYRALSIAYTPMGKPFFTGREDLSFSISHSGHLACAALIRTPGGIAPRLGIDIQEVPQGDTLSRYLELADRFFSPAFRQELRCTPEEEKPRVFTRLWSATEAVGKATGQGGVDFRAAEGILRSGGTLETRHLLDSFKREYELAVVLLPTRDAPSVSPDTPDTPDPR